MNLIVAALLCIATFSLKKYIDKFIKYNFLSSFLTLFIFLAFFVLPIVFCIYQITNEVLHIDISKLSLFVKESKERIISLLHSLPDSLETQAIDAIKSINVNTIISHIMSISGSVGKIGVNFVTDLVFILIFLYLFYYYGTYLRAYIIDIIPFDKQTSNEILDESSGVLKVVFFTTIISMILQGFSFGIVATIFGFSGILFGVLYALASVIPVVGGALVWVPLGLYIYWNGNLGVAIFIALYSLIFIGFVIDNVIKPLIIGIVNKTLLSKPVKMNEMIIFIAILAGLASFGFWGIIIGPTISTFFLALLRVYENQFKNKQKEVKL